MAMSDEEIDKKLLEQSQAEGATEEQEGQQADTALAEEALEASEKVAEETTTEQAAEAQQAAAAESEEGQGQSTEVSGAFAQMKRDHAAEVALLQSQISAHSVAPQQTAVPAMPVEKSPRQVFLDENPEAEFFPPAVEIAEEKFKTDQAAKTTEATRQQTALNTVTASLEKGGVEITSETHGTGLLTLISVGQHLLTQKDKESIWMAGEEAGEQMHSILTRRIKKAGITLPSKAVTKPPAGKQKTTTTPAKTVNEQQNEESEVQGLDPHVADLCSELGIQK